VPDPFSARIVVPARLETSGSDITAIATAIGDDLASLKNLLAPLHELWSGQANISWAELQQIWDTAAADLMSAPGVLGQIGLTTNTNWHNYVETENANIQTWKH
jgi:WXG100 family type VII secretion target